MPAETKQVMLGFYGNPLHVQRHRDYTVTLTDATGDVMVITAATAKELRKWLAATEHKVKRGKHNA